ncbi:MAG TPA: DegT/DnrJ/EryC1/StrS family aminotransferase, partial [Candidatus Dormibacteraeota bacterium]
IDDLALPHFNGDGREDVFQNYVVRSKSGDKFSDHMKANGVEVLVQWRKPYYRHEALKLEDRGFPETEALSAQVCSLPMAVELEDSEVDYVIRTVRSFYGLS